MKYQHIEHYRHQGLSLERLCKLFGVSRSGYYKWRSQVADKRAQERQECRLIKQVWEASSRTYGSPRIDHELRAQGIQISQKRVAKLMKQLGIAGAGKKPRKWRTTVASATHPVAKRLLFASLIISVVICQSCLILPPVRLLAIASKVHCMRA